MELFESFLEDAEVFHDQIIFFNTTSNYHLPTAHRWNNLVKGHFVSTQQTNLPVFLIHAKLLRVARLNLALTF